MPDKPTECPSCGKMQMRLVRTIPKAGGNPQLFVFRCTACNHVETREER